MIKKHTKISLLWLSMVCGSLFGVQDTKIERTSLSEMFQSHIKKYAFIPHSKREAGFFAAGTVGMGYLWALSSKSVPGYVKCILVAPPAVAVSQLALSKLGLLGPKVPAKQSQTPSTPNESSDTPVQRETATDTPVQRETATDTPVQEEITFVPVCANLTPSVTVASYRKKAENPKGNDALSAEQQAQFEDVKDRNNEITSSQRSSTEEEPVLRLGDNTRVDLSKEGKSKGLNKVFDSMQDNCKSVARDAERLKRIASGSSTSDTGVTWRSWWPFGKNS